MADTPVADMIRERIRARELAEPLPPPQKRRALREAAGLTCADVGAAVNASRQAVSLWERGRRSPRGRYLEAYVEALRAMREAASA